jgi:hypothetical protein
VRLVVDADRLADDVAIAAESILPEAVREDDDLVVAEDDFLFVARPAGTFSGRSMVARLTGPPPHALMSAKAVASRFQTT